MKERILELASLDAIRAFDEVIKDGTREQLLAARIVQLGLLSLRDTVNRTDRPEIYRDRLAMIELTLGRLTRD